MSEITPTHDLTPYTKVRFCSNCNNEVHYFDHISIIGKRRHIRGSFNLNDLNELWNEFQDESVDIHCDNCYKRFKYNVCRCGHYRHTKEIIILDKSNRPITFSLCRKCCYDLFSIDFDNYDERRYRKELSKRNIL